MNDLGHNIRMVREANGMSQTDLASRIGRTRAAISQYENGKAQPSMPTLQAIADSLDVPVAELVGDRIVGVSAGFADGRKRELESIYCKLSDSGRDVLMATARALLKAQGR